MMSSEENETGHANFGVLINQLCPDQKSLVRNIERIDKKIVNVTNGIKFLETCIIENLLPNFTDIYIYIYIYTQVKCV